MSEISELLDKAEKTGYGHVVKTLHPELPEVRYYPCVSTVLMTMQEVFAPKYIPDDKDNLMARATAPLAGGRIIPHCGVLLGGMLAIGMKNGLDVVLGNGVWMASTGPVKEFYDRFQKEFGFVNCWDYSHCDFWDQLQIQKHRETGGLEKCAKMLGKACRIIGEFLTREER